MATFVSWAAEKIKVQNQIAALNDQLLSVSISTEGRSKTRRQLSELQKYYEWVQKEAAIEAGTRSSNRIRVSDVT